MSLIIAVNVQEVVYCTWNRYKYEIGKGTASFGFKSDGRIIEKELSDVSYEETRQIVRDMKIKNVYMFPEVEVHP